MEPYGSDVIITPRLYQTELEEIAVRKNTIIHLPTGSGKTYIAIRLIKRLRDALQKPWGEGGKRCFFLVNTVPLVIQQKKMVEYMCPVDGVAGFSSENRVDLWDKSKWDIELSKHQVIVATSQILCDMLTHQYISLSDINLIIFDECHHAVEDHPMRLIMKHFENCPKQEQPRILGLTATLLNGNVKLNKVEEILRELETTFQATIATANDMGEVAPHSTNPKEILQHYRNPALNSATQEAIALLKELQCIIISVKLPHSVANPNIRLKPGQRDITEKDGKKIIKEVKNMIESMILTINEMGAYGGAIGILAYVIAFERRKRWAQSEQDELLFNVAITHSTEARVVLLQSMAKETGYERIVKHSSERILQLLNILKEYSPGYVAQAGALMKINYNKSALSGLILTKQRFTAKVLYNLLKDVKEVNPIDFGFLKHDFIVGFNINPFTNTREQYFTKKLNQQALLKFRNGNLNCLISTSVLEEGVDIPQCLLVVRYDIPLEYRSYMQSKGRARSKESSYVVLVDREIEAKFRSQYIEFQKIEEYVHKLLHGNPHDRDAPTEEDVQAGLYNDDDVPPYCTESGIQLSGTDAIRLLFRYCSRLPHDQFTNITPMWVQEKIKEKNMIELYRLITIYMPLQCPVKEPIQGLPYVNLKTAKRSAALNVCKRLHEVGELDEVTLLPRQYGKIDFNQEDVKVCFLNWKDEDEHVGTDVPKPGFKKRMRKHPKVYPKCLDGPTKGWQNDNVLYLHVIRLSVAFKEPTDSRERVLYNLLRQKEGYGFVTNQPLPILCSFPIFLTVGEVKTSLEVNYAKIVITSDHFELIKRFHFFVFDQVLEVAKKFLMFDGAVDNLYVVPLKVVEDGYDIDWSFMGGHPEIEPVTEPAVSDRESLVVSNETYLNAVVTPWYRGSILPDRYIVSAILEYKTPQSRFESASFETFEDYYSSKHNLQIYGPKDQPLLEVRSINSRMNCLLPRAATINALTDKQRKLVSHAQGDDSPRRFDEIFVPEFCIKDEYPGVLWYKAILLPSIVHRLSMLLSAEELRDQIAKDTIKGYKPLVKGEEWLPIEIDLHMAVKSLLSNIEEPTAVNSIDRINNPIDAAPRTPNIMSVKESVYQLQKKKLTKEYPWDERNEPIDIDRTLSTVTVMDIECFDAFVTAPLHAEVATSPSRVLSPPRVVPGSAAILPPPVKYDDKIAILSKTPTTRGPELRDIVAALTTINSHDTFNLERAETLGDSFLKFAATLYLFHKFPALDEGQLTNIKGRLIGNRNLYYAGERAQLGGRMKVEQFSPRRDFVVPGFAAPPQVADFIEERCIRPTFLIGMQFPTEDALSGELSDEGWDHIRQRFEDWENRAETEPYGQAQNSMQCYIRHQAVSDKSVADSVEALIGTYLCSGGIASAVSFLEWMRILPPKDNFMGYLNRKVETVITQGKNTVTEVDWLLNQCRGDIENILNYKFKDPALLLEALSHASYIRNRYTRSYERLEFLGDAILDFLITSHIYENSPKLKPGELTDLRSSLVNNVTFASYVVKLGLHKFLCTQMNASLENAIKTFVEHQEERGHEIVEDVLYLIDEEDCRIAQYIDVPKTLSDIFESIAGAIYLDTGGDLQTVWSVVYRIMYKEINAFTLNIPKQPVRVLMETIHACPSFGETKQTTSGIPKIMIPVTFTKQGIQHTAFGVGTNKSQAKRAAAKLALKILAV
ncbi:endoribonuclease Dicer isoform X2 [Bicyclus anynana]|nr:endoribonuclease Dicer isoform X2 [Bicyclus anynana]XP_052740941.1 endoribonuclease Dicer isoform X2 [Bicyclus anynana]XP_052740942.1 endoribonuclease Dicer isoform X2 [Bicyclus anynana]